MRDASAALGRIICNLRRAAGISQETLAERAGLHRTYVSQLERGIKSPTITVLLKISQALNTPLSDIVRSLERETNGLQGS